MAKRKRKNDKRKKGGKLKAGWIKFLNKIKPSISSSDWTNIITDSFKEYIKEIENMTDEEQLREIKSFLKTIRQKKKNGKQ